MGLEPDAVGTSAVEALEEMFAAWPGFRGSGEPGEIGASLWKRIETEDSDSITPSLGVAVDIVHAGDTGRELSMGEDVQIGVQILVKIWVYDERKTREQRRAAKALLERLTGETFRLMMNSDTGKRFGHEHGSSWFGVDYPRPPTPYAKYGRKGNERYSLSIYYLQAPASYRPDPDDPRFGPDFDHY